VPQTEVRVGAWAAAVGRALDPDPSRPPTVSLGVVSAVGRVWGKLLQTDAKVSPVNYGGPLVAADGRVFGVLAPASPDAAGDTAGAEWYDSGIGFAVPLADVFAALPRLRAGESLKPGKLGFAPKEPGRPYTAPVVVGTLVSNSPLAAAGVKVGDVLTAVDGKPAPNLNRWQHLLGPRYAGDAVKLTVRTGDAEREVTVALIGDVARRGGGFLGILPDRAAGPGVTVRYVFPDGPAAKAGLKAGDRLTKLTSGDRPMVPIPDRDELAEFVAEMAPGTELNLERQRDGKSETVAVTLAAIPDAATDQPAASPTGEPSAKLTPGLTTRTNPTTKRTAWLRVPDGLKTGARPGLVVWLHPVGGDRDAEAVSTLWAEVAADRGLILAGPASLNPDGWLASEADEVLADIRKLRDELGVDPSRVVAVGAGAGGRMAFHLGFAGRDLVRGVAVIGSDLGGKPRDPIPERPLSFFLTAGGAGGAKALREAGYPVTVREGAGEVLDADAVKAVAVWADALDRI
jgi:serine protease Do